LPVSYEVNLHVLFSTVKVYNFATGQALSEVSKDKVASRSAETNTTQFMKALESVETGLLKHINYLTTVSTGLYHAMPLNYLSTYFWPCVLYFNFFMYITYFVV